MAIVQHPTNYTDYPSLKAFYEQFKARLTVQDFADRVEIRASDPDIITALANALRNLNSTSPAVLSVIAAATSGGVGGSDPRVDGLMQDVAGLKAADTALHQDILGLQSQDATQTTNHQQLLARVQGLEGKAAAVKAAL